MLPVLVVIYLSVAIHLGLNPLYHSVLGLPAVAAFFGLQALVVRIFSHTKFLSIFIRVLFAEAPLALLIINACFWPVLSFIPFLAGVLAVTLIFSVIAWKKEVTTAWLLTVVLFTLPLFLRVATTSPVTLIEFTNEWRLLAEEGQVMGWVTKVSHGGVPFLDMIVTRGPIVIYTTALALREFGQNLVIARAWILTLSILMMYGGALFCLTFFESKLLRWLSLFLMLLIHDISYRTGFAMASLGLFWIGFRQNRGIFTVLCGMCVALALLSSLESGAAALIAIFGTVIVAAVTVPDRRAFARHGALVAAGLGIVLVPPSLFFLSRGELGEIINGVIVYPKYAMLGFASSPFPNVLKIFRNEMNAGHFWFSATQRVFALWYMPPLVYLFTFFLFLRWAVSRSLDRRVLMILMLAIYGWVMFRSALGRSDFHHLYFCVPPAFALCLLHADRIKSSLSMKGLFQNPDHLAALFFACLLPVWFLWQRPNDRLIPVTQNFAQCLTGTSDIPEDFQPFQTPRLRGILLPAPIRNKMEMILKTVDSERKPGDCVYAFPTIPLYYFLLDSPNPTRYEWAYQAITHDMRVEALQSLERAKPRFIINSLDPHRRLDGIPPWVALPEIWNYMQDNYKRWALIGREEILVPKDSELWKKPIILRQPRADMAPTPAEEEPAE